MTISKLSEAHLDTCVDLFVEVFTKEPWNDVYESRDQVATFFRRHMGCNYFIGYILAEGDNVVALSLGMKKPWLKGMEYYIDQFCVRPDLQHKGIGSSFLTLIEHEIRREGMNALILNTEQGFPSERFYLKNGFQLIEGLNTLVKEV